MNQPNKLEKNKLKTQSNSFDYEKYTAGGSGTQNWANSNQSGKEQALPYYNGPQVGRG
jgi:hypothetical protein